MIFTSMGPGASLWTALLELGIAGIAVSVIATLGCLFVRIFRRRIPRGLPLAIGFLFVLSALVLATLLFGTTNETVK